MQSSIINDKHTITYVLNERENQHPLPWPCFLQVGQVQDSEGVWTFKEHYHEEYEYLLILRGRMRYWINGIEHHARPGDVYFVQPGQRHREQPISKVVDFFFLKFTLPTPDGQTMHLVQPPGHPEQQQTRDKGGQIQKLWEMVIREIRQEKPGAIEIAEAAIMQIIWLFLRNKGILPSSLNASQYQDRKDRVLTQAEQHLRLNLGRTVSLNELASYCGISDGRLWHLFKETTGTSPHQYQLQLRMEEAQRLLRESSLAAYEIAQRLGFADASHFTQSFRKIFNMTPSVYSQRVHRKRLCS